MNQPDANYWLSLAAAWIQNKTQTQMNFPRQMEISHYHHFPQVNNVPTENKELTDNHIEADMEIEDDEPNTQETVSQIFPIKSAQSPPTQFDALCVNIPSAPMISHIIESVDMDLSDENDDSVPSIEAQKRKKLPVWIREGLERMEREKKHEAIRIKKEQEMQEDEEIRKKIMEDALRELEREKQNIIKSKFDSEPEDDEDNELELETQKPEPGNQAKIKNDEDAYEKMMLLVRKTLTEILLEVTDEKIHEISRETLSKFRKKGLGAYEDSSDDYSEDDSEKNDEHDTDWEPDSVLKERIRAKSFAFEQRAKEIKEKLAKITEVEHKRFKNDLSDQSKLKSKYDSEDDKSSKNRKIGEEKCEQINSFSSTLASSSRRDKKKTRFNDPKDRSNSQILVTHVGMMDSSSKKSFDNNGSSLITPTLHKTSIDQGENQPSRKNQKRDSSSSSSSSSSYRHKKHKKHKKTSKHSKKSKKRDRSRDYGTKYKSDRHSMESKTSVRSAESSKRHRSRSRSHENRRRRY